MATGEALPFRLIAVEAAPPHVVQVYRVPEHLLDEGRREYLRWLERLAQCGAERSFTGFSEDELDLQIPKWAEVQLEEG